MGHRKSQFCSAPNTFYLPLSIFFLFFKHKTWHRYFTCFLICKTAVLTTTNKIRRNNCMCRKKSKYWQQQVSQKSSCSNTILSEEKLDTTQLILQMSYIYIFTDILMLMPSKFLWGKNYKTFSSQLLEKQTFFTE